jgi:hypothetical protein
MKNLILLATALVLMIAPPALAQDAPAAEPEVKAMTLRKLVAVRILRCDALMRGKQATTSANIHRSQARHTRGVIGLNNENEIKRFEGVAGRAFEDAGSAKRRLTRMSDRFLKEQRAAWYATPDIARRIQIEKMILGAKEILAEPCG